MATIRERFRKDGKPVYNVQVRVDGYPSQTRSFPSKTAAQRWAKVEEAKIIEGRAIRGAEAHRRTLSEAIEQYKTDQLPRLKSDGMHSAAITWWGEKLGKTKLVDLTAPVIIRQRSILLREKYQRARPKSKRTSLKDGETPNEFSRTPATANRYVAVLSSMLGYVLRELHWIAHNPCEEIKRLPERPNRARVLTPIERKALLTETAKDATLHLFVTMALHTACRAGELLKLTWADVDTDAGKVVYRNTKNGETRAAWLHGDALELLKTHAEGTHEATDAVFQNASKRGVYQYAEKFQAACTAAGLGKSHAHNLRHTAATILAQAGASEQQLKAVGGWKSSVVSRYVHMQADDVRSITKQLSEKV
jgi:integrase